MTPKLITIRINHFYQRVTFVFDDGTRDIIPLNPGMLANLLSSALFRVSNNGQTVFITV
jgi:hypothetical protein